MFQVIVVHIPELKFVSGEDLEKIRPGLTNKVGEFLFSEVKDELFSLFDHKIEIMRQNQEYPQEVLSKFESKRDAEVEEAFKVYVRLRMGKLSSDPFVFHPDGNVELSSSLIEAN